MAIITKMLCSVIKIIPYISEIMISFHEPTEPAKKKKNKQKKDDLQSCCIFLHLRFYQDTSTL